MMRPTSQQASITPSARHNVVVTMLPAATPTMLAQAKPTNAKQVAMTRAGIAEHSFAQQDEGERSTNPFAIDAMDSKRITRNKKGANAKCGKKYAAPREDWPISASYPANHVAMRRNKPSLAGDAT